MNGFGIVKYYYDTTPLTESSQKIYLKSTNHPLFPIAA